MTESSKPLSARARVGAARGTGLADQIRQQLEPHKAEVIEKLVELAKAGDPASMKLFMERAAPLPKPDPERVNVVGFAEAPTLGGKAKAVLDAMANGTVSVESGTNMMRALDIYAKTITADNHERRLAALEAGKVAVTAVIDNDSGESVVENFEDLI